MVDRADVSAACTTRGDSRALVVRRGPLAAENHRHPGSVAVDGSRGRANPARRERVRLSAAPELRFDLRSFCR